MNALEESIIRAVAAGRIVHGTMRLAQRVVEQLDRGARLAASRPKARAEAHHQKVRREAEREIEEVKAETWTACCARSRVDHRGALACEACHHHATSGGRMEPHHLVLGNRTDAPEVVMALCGGCHRLNLTSAHRAPRAFARVVVIPWAKAHGYQLPNRKEYREEEAGSGPDHG